MSDSSERTERATPKRMKEVRQKGKLGSSRDLTAWLGMAAGALALPAVLGSGTDATSGMVAGFRAVIDSPNPLVALDWLGNGLTQVVPILAPLFAAVLVGTIAGAALQGGIHAKQLRMTGEHFNLVKGVQRIFGLQSLWEGAKALLKTAVVAAVLVIAIQGLVPLLMTAGGMSVSSLLDTASGAVGSLIQAAVAAGIGLALIDVLVVMRRNRKHTRMTKKELRDETKNTEGDPLVRAQRRSRQLAMSRNRMIAAVGGADVVLLNPTHVAVALKYEPGRSAPRVVAKGAGAVAAKIRERAAATRVPMVQDVPLARALHAACDVGEEIPVELYSAVARVLAFVMSLKARGASLGVHRLAPVPA
ncbi:flagellar biosynthesis protein FlhB [Naasia sp. SYSU D00948]|uniref:EscU/YscU/HrcU family type III secretion system export apparatus switch protein n=1 Tax=Naasia sp. SYSU D00948 TaxID=2817379 RepID=UPI001B3188BA|nr:EscU/YscU/HrcU family type III secretion system export apparatus switch protein [Naasia sp. SYSU D00948]